jgi:peptidoglycan glycosyltransferase
VNAPLRRVAISVLVLFTLLILNVNYIQVVQADKLRSDPGNTRTISAEYSRARGSITVGGTEIAKSVKTKDSLAYLRQYPQAQIYAPVTGYYSLIYGSWGIERADNGILSGSDPKLFVRHLTDLFTGRDPSGGDVALTLDAKAQQTAMSALDGHIGAVAALDPSTGKILALASTPTYDPNQMSSHDPKAIEAYGQQLAAQNPDPRDNLAISERYSPGSVFKVIVSAAALATGSYTPQTPVPAPDRLNLPNSTHPLTNFNGESCNGGADQPLIQALTISCNTAFGQLGMTLGQDKVTSMAKAFGIDDSPFDTPLKVVPSTVGQIQDQAQLANASIGQQNVQITPLQGAMIAAAVANHGTLMKPFLVDSLRAPDLTVIDQTNPRVMSRPISSQVAGELTTMMTSVVANGTGKNAQIPGIQVAGKTGTAQTDPDAKDNSWFVGFAPADHPKIAIAVFIKGGGRTGGDLSAPIARQVMQAYLSGQGG